MLLKNSVLPVLFCAVCLPFVVGCGGAGDRPPLGTVSGKVTLDGEPLEGAQIVVQPDKGRAGSAILDKNGKYDIMYAYKIRGAKVGPASISFNWPTGSTPTKALPRESEFKVEVIKGKNVFDYDLKSDEKPDPNKAKAIAD